MSPSQEIVNAILLLALVRPTLSTKTRAAHAAEAAKIIDAALKRAAVEAMASRHGTREGHGHFPRRK